MGRPLLLLEANSAYRGDFEDRLTEVFATALHENDAFCREILHALDLPATSNVRVRTQVWCPNTRARVDLVLEVSDQRGHRMGLAFFEHKYNPRRNANPYWFSKDQAERQHKALAGEIADAHTLVAIASKHDLTAEAVVPAEYDRLFNWTEIAELADRAGGPGDWRRAAREPSAPASARILLEFWSYLKGDPVGAIDADDLDALGRAAQAEERVERLLELAAEELEWEPEVGDEWVTAEEVLVRYVLGDAPEDSWVAARRDGALYLMQSDAEWDDARPVGEPQLYAGAGFSAKRDERAAVLTSDWPAAMNAAGLEVIGDSTGIYLLGRRPLAELLEARTISAQVNDVAAWVRKTAAAALDSAPPPDSDTSGPSSKSRRRP